MPALPPPPELIPFRPAPPGSILGLPSPASPIAQDKLALGLAALAGLDYRVYQPPMEPGSFPYLAGDDEFRADQFNRLAGQADLAGLLALRGGYGCLRMIDRLDLNLLLERRLPLVGFSDLTVILSALLRVGLQSIHGPSLQSLDLESPASLGRLADILAGGWADTEPLAGHLLADGDPAEGYLTGGNMTVLAHLIATPWQPPSRGAIVFLEDVNESLYRTDRAVTHLRLAGFFDDCRGVVLGRFGDLDPQEVDRLMTDRLADLGVPVLAGLAIGHRPDNLALVVGGRARLDPADQALYPVAGE